MVRGSQVALKHVIYDMETRTLVMELRWRAIKRWVPCGDMDRGLKIPQSAKAECGFWTTPEECLYKIAVQSAFSIGPHITIQKKTRACLQNELIIGSLSHSIRFFHKKKYTVRQRKYCDKLAENFKSVFVCNIIMAGLFYFNFFKMLLLKWPTFSMTYFQVFFRMCWADLYYK